MESILLINPVLDASIQDKSGNFGGVKYTIWTPDHHTNVLVGCPIQDPSHSSG